MENEIIQAIILGIVQGITEFLPISSSAHLVLTPWLFGWEDPGLTFDVALHVGTLVAVVGFFWKDWLMIFSSFFSNVDKRRNENGNPLVYPRRLLILLVIATIPGVLAGYYFNEQAETLFREPFLVGSMLVIFGALLYWVDRKSRQRRSVSDLSVKDSILIGLSQALAIIPGVSRSGITITAGLHQGLKRKEAARFSFLLSTPIIFGAATYQARELVEHGIGSAEIMGIIASAISGYFAIYWLIRFVEKSSYGVFFWYRLILAFVIMITAIFVK